MQKGFAPIILVLMIAGLILAGGFWAYKNNFKNVRQVNSYEDCTKAGYPVLLSYPGQCNTPDGQHFVQELSEEEKQKLIPPMLQCKRDALICPDGSSVGRTGPNCEFAPCPSE